MSQQGRWMSSLAVPVSVLALLLAIWALSQGLRSKGDADARTPVASLESVIKSGKLRCSYLVYAPYINKEPNSGKLSGIFYDVMMELGKNAGLTVEWVEEVGYDNIFTGLDSGRHDVFCGGLWPNATRAKAGSFSVPIFYSVVKTWVRAGENRFASMDEINSPDVSIAVIDGAMEDIIARTDFPKAKRVSLPQLSPFTQNLLNITSRRADLTFAEPGIIAEYNKANDGALKEIFPNQPQRIFGNALVVRRGNDQLRDFLDVGLRELLFTGRVDRILAVYEPAPNVFPRATLPYRVEK
jgi:polar amino acid transport system substrate-binding protein